MLMISAQSMAEANGEALFEAKRDESSGDFITQLHYGLAEGENPDNSSSKNNIKKMEFDFENVDVEIIGNQEFNRIDLYNFTEGFYSATTHVGGAYTLEDLTGLLKMISFGTSGINFKGFRNLLFYKEYAELDRKVVIYIKEDSRVSNISCSVKDGSITVKNLTVATDLTLKSDNGDITVDRIADHSSVKIDVGSGSVTVKDSKLYAIMVKSNSAPVDMINSPVSRSLSIKADNANVYYEHIAPTYEGFDVEFLAKDGTLLVDGEVKNSGKFVLLGAPDSVDTSAPETNEDGTPVETEEPDEEETVGESEFAPYALSINVSKGNITVNLKEFNVPEDPTPEEGENGDSSEDQNS